MQVSRVRDKSYLTPFSHQIRSAEITDAEQFKKDELGRGIRTSQFDICACKDGSIKIAPVGLCGLIKPELMTSTDARWK